MMLCNEGNTCREKLTPKILGKYLWQSNLDIVRSIHDFTTKPRRIFMVLSFVIFLFKILKRFHHKRRIEINIDKVLEKSVGTTVVVLVTNRTCPHTTLHSINNNNNRPWRCTTMLSKCTQLVTAHCIKITTHFLLNVLTTKINQIPIDQEIENRNSTEVTIKQIWRGFLFSQVMDRILKDLNSIQNSVKN